MADIKIASDSGKLYAGVDADLEVYNDGSHSYIKNTVNDQTIVLATTTGDSTTTAVTVDGSNDVTIAGNLTVNKAITFNETSVDADFRVESANNDHMLFVDGGNDMVIIGHSAPEPFDAFGNEVMLQVHSASTAPYGGIGVIHHSNDADGGVLILSSSRATSLGGDTIVADDDLVGRIEFQGMDGADLETAARITGEIDGTPGSDDMPGRLVFATTADLAHTPTERMRIDSSGNVGIGTDSPSNILTTNSSSNGALTQPFKISNAGSGSGTDVGMIFYNGDGASSGAGSIGRIKALDVGSYKSAMAFEVSNQSGWGNTTTERMRITNDGVGIGSSSPNISSHTGTVLTVANTTGDLYPQLIIGGNRDAGGNQIGTINFWNLNGTDDEVARIQCVNEGAVDDGVLSFHTAPTGGSIAERMTILENGYVGIGQTDPGYQLVVMSVDDNYVGYFQNDGNAATRYGIKVVAGADDASGTTKYLDCFAGAGAAVGWIANTSGTFALTDSSDERIKENIRDTEIDGLDAINSMQVRDFEWKNSGETCIGGLVAQELEPVFAPAVTGEDGAMEEDGRIKPMGVSRDRLVPVLVKAIQELTAKVEALEAK